VPSRPVRPSTAAAVRSCLRRREDSLPQTPYFTLDHPPVDRQPIKGFVLWSVHPDAVGGLGRRGRHRVQLALRFRCRPHRLFTGSPGPRQHPFGSGQRPYPAGYPRRPAEELTNVSRFPAAFRLPALASWAILRPLGNRAFLTVGLPSASLLSDPNGVVTFRTSEIRPGWVPPIPRGRRCSPDRHRVFRSSPTASQRHVLAPAAVSHLRGFR
jgi:hypothetical protein